ncbi:MAG: hypothetical protein JW776_04795 [Candidatus Lokiarchaeota archaeon]|nr:hypothetical protein [Candidatus Lokiarchaeota archaeon]
MAEQEKFEYKHGFRHGPTFVAIFIIYFIVFGVLSNYWQKGDIIYKPIRDNVLFIYQNFFNFPGYEYVWSVGGDILDFGTWYIFFILFFTAVFVGYSQDFLIHAFKRNIWLIPIVIFLSVFWNGINDVYYYRNFIRNASFIFTIFMNLGRYFTSIHGYINLLALLVVFGGGGLLGGYLKILRREILYKKARLIISDKEVAQ